MPNSFILVLTTLPTLRESRELAYLILEKKLAACVNILGPAQSLFWWKNKIDRSREYFLLIKTQRLLFSKLEQWIRRNHSYSVPEIISLPIQEGSQLYLDWLSKSLRPR